MNYGANIKKLRLAAGLNQIQLAKLAKIGLRTMKRWESDRNKEETTEMYIKLVLFYEKNKDKL